MLPHIRIFFGILGKFQGKLTLSGTSSEWQSANVILPGVCLSVSHPPGGQQVTGGLPVNSAVEWLEALQIDQIQILDLSPTGFVDFVKLFQIQNSVILSYKEWLLLLHGNVEKIK